MGMLFGGGGDTISTVAPKLGALNVQTSSFGMAVPLVYGQTRISANLIWYGDFTAIPHTTTQSAGGKGGGGVESSNTTFTYTVAVAMGLCEGVISGINTVWATKQVTNMSALGLSLFTGTSNQSPWGFLTTNHPGQALGYQNTAYVANPAYDLGSSASLPNHTFEVLALYNYSPATGYAGAKAEVLVKDYLTNVQYGVGISATKIGDLTLYGQYCLAAGIILSPAYTEQSAANTHIDELMQATNSAVVWSEGLIKIIPFGDTAITGAWGSYTPNNAVRYDLNDDDFIGDSGGDPITVQRKTQADAYNQVQVEFLDSANQYNPAIATASDLANIDLYGLRPMQPLKMHGITHLSAAQTVAQFTLQRALYIRNTYEFTLGMRYCLLEPMDIVTLTDAALGLAQFPVRITTIEETQDGLFKLVAEEFLAGVSHADTYPSQTGQGYQTNYNVTAGSANAPVIFEPPTTLSLTPQIWLATSGGQYWGGCEVWVSRDNASYAQVGVINGGARHGVLSAALSNGSDPDTTNTLAVDLTVSKGSLLGGTLLDRDTLNTLCYADGELISYQNAALTSANKYNLTSLRRGAYGTAKGAHLINKKFARLDQAIFKYDYDPSLIGNNLYIKLRSFNIYGLQREDLAGLTPIVYAVTGANLGSIAGLALAQPWVGNSVKVKWNAYAGADTYRVEIWQSGAIKRTVTGIANTSYEYTVEDMRADGGPWRAIDIKLYAVSSNGASSAAATITVANPQLPTPTGLNATAAPLAITVSATKPIDSDWAGMLIYGSSSSGFTPAVGNLLFDGKDNSHTFTGLAAGIAIFYRVAFYDVYGQDSLNFSSEITATPMAAGGVRIVSSLPAAGVQDGDVVSLTTDHKLYRWNQSTTAWVTWVDGSDILASSITTGKLAADSVQAINISAGQVTASKISVSDLSAINANFSGNLNAATGTFNGTLLAGVLDLNSAIGETYIYDFANSGATVVAPTGKTSMRVTIFGGTGGGGGGGCGAGSGNGGGGGGGVDSVIYTQSNITAGTYYTITVGAAGIGGTGAPGGQNQAGNNGTNGGVSFIRLTSGSLLASSNGGGGGQGGTNPLVTAQVALGGAGSGSSTANGGNGTNATPSNFRTTAGYGGQGGIGTSLSRAGLGGRGSASFDSIGGNGANGVNGRVLVEFFNPNSVVLQTQYSNLKAQLAAQFGYVNTGGAA